MECLQALQKPIQCRLPRRINFIQTTRTKLLNAPEINYLFNDSPLEDTLFDVLNSERIPNERQWLVKVNDKNRFVDFAIFCNANDIAIECDGNTYHDSQEQVHNDKQRDNELKSKGWSVMRFTTKAIRERMAQSVNLLKDAINSQGGLKIDNRNGVKFIRTNNQLGLFDL